MNIDQFLKAFEKKVKSMPKKDMKWKLYDVRDAGGNIVNPGRIRGFPSKKDNNTVGYCCPIAFQNGDYNSIAFTEAMQKLGINPIDGEKIIKAADNEKDADPIIRKRLLDIVGLR